MKTIIYNLEDVRESWRKEPDDNRVFRAANEDIEEYPQEIQIIIKEEAKRRLKVATENDKLNKEIKDSFGGSLLSKLLFGLSWFILLLLLTCPFLRIDVYDPDAGTVVSSRWPWEVALGCAITWFFTAYCSFLLAKRGKRQGKC